MLWQLGSLVLCLFLLVPIVRGLFAVHLLERRASCQPQSFVMTRAFHRPVYGTCLLLLGLRVVFFALTAISNLEEMSIFLRLATFALLDMPSVAMAALYGYLLLFAVRVVFQRRWPGASSSSNNGVLTVVFVAFCVSLVILVTLVAICRAEGDKWGLVVPQWMMFGYSAMIWTTLGLLMLKYQGQAVQILWRYRRRHQWRVTEKWSKTARLTLPVLTIACLKNLAMCSTLLAELLVAHGVVCAVIASQNSENAIDIIEVVGSWRHVTLHYFSWEVASLVVVLRMLHQTPIAVHCLSDESRDLKKSAVHRSETPSAPTIDDDEIHVEFQVPNVHGLIADYVVPSNASPIAAGRRHIMENETHGSGASEHRFCSLHDIGTPVGAEYVKCRCYRERGDDRFLSSANVPLLAEESDPVCEGRLPSISIAIDEENFAEARK